MPGAGDRCWEDETPPALFSSGEGRNMINTNTNKIISGRLCSVGENPTKQCEPVTRQDHFR